MVTIRGINLGVTYDDVCPYIMVGGHSCNCSAYRDYYIPSETVVCSTAELNREISQGQVVVSVRGDSRYIAKSNDNFSYVDPVIEEIFPIIGPQSGGTELSITGQYMDAGSLVEVFIFQEKFDYHHIKKRAALGEVLYHKCEIIYNNVTYILCRTSTTENMGNGTVQVVFDGAERNFYGKAFHYMEDPIVNSTAAPNSGVKYPGGIPR